MTPLTTVLFQTATPDPGVGPEELVDLLPDLVRAGWFLVGFLLVVVLGWYVVEPVVSRGIRRRNRNNPTLQEAISRYVRLVVLVVAVFVGAGAAGFGQVLQNSALVVAAVTLAIGVAGQAVIGSLVSGLALVADPEFNVGNYIRWGDREGEVESITLRVTRVHTPDGELVTIPNTTLTNEAVSRPYGRGRSRIVERIGIAYEDDLDEALGDLRDAATTVEDVLEDPAPEAYVDEFGGDAVIVRVHYWVTDPRPRDVVHVRSAFAREAKSRLERSGVVISPPSKRELQGRIAVDDSPGAPA